MQKESKQSGAKVIGSFERRYNRSLITLTVLYTLVLAVILSISAGVGYSAFSKRLERRFNRLPPPPSGQVVILFDRAVPSAQLPERAMPTAADVRADFVRSLVATNGTLIILASILSYFLAKMTLRPIKSAYDRQREFLANASHELRTPLSILQLELENELADTALADSHKERTRSNLEEVGKMSKLVGDLLLLSRIDEDAASSGKTTVIDFGSMLESAVDRLRPLARSHNVGLILKKHEGADASLETNEDLLFQAMTNIIKNGIIYNKEGGTVEVQAYATKTKASVKVIDTGVGIKKEDLGRIFDRFYRIDASRSRETGGSGLGLSIVRSAVLRLGGKISIESEFGKGTTIVIELPRT